MKLFRKAKDGGPQSTVTGYWLVEIKSLFSVVLLKFEDGSREEFHSHAFNSISWILKGRLLEQLLDWPGHRIDREVERGASLLPVITKRDTFHRVYSDGTSWVLSFRGPWSKTWLEWGKHGTTVLTTGRRVLWPVH